MSDEASGEVYTVEGRDVTPGEAVALAADLLDWARANGAGDPKVVELLFPVATKVDGRPVDVTSVTLRQPLVGDLRAIKALPAHQQGLSLIERLSGLPGPVFNRLTAVDADRLDDVAAGFNVRSLPDGPSDR